MCIRDRFVAVVAVASFVVAAIGAVAAANIAGVAQESNLLKVPLRALKSAVAFVVASVVAWAWAWAWAAWAGLPDVSWRQIWKQNYS